MNRIAQRFPLCVACVCIQCVQYSLEISCQASREPVKRQCHEGQTTLLEKQSKFPRYNMKCRGKPDTTLTIPCSITFSPLQSMLYRGKSIIFRTVGRCRIRNRDLCPRSLYCDYKLLTKVFVPRLLPVFPAILTSH